MKDKTFIFTIISILALFNYSCVVSRPDCTGVSEPDYNQRVNISDPHFHKTLSSLGVGSIAASTIAGGYVGYKADFVKYNSGSEQKKFTAGSAVMGAALGFTTSFIINKALGWGKTSYYVDEKKWLKKANRNFIVLNYSNSERNTDYESKLRVMPKKIESDFIIKDINDANQFVRIFPKSKYTNEVMKTGIEYCSREEIPQLINIFPKSKYVSDAKIKYIQSSLRYSDICEGVKRYSEVKKDFEPDFLNLIRNANNGIDFYDRFERSLNYKQAYFNSFWEADQKISSLKNLDNKYNSVINQISREDTKKQNNDIRRNYFDRCFRYVDFTFPDEIDDFYKNYNWLDYSGKSTDLIRNYFNVADKYISEGDLILWMLRNLPNKAEHPHIAFATSREIESFINQKLKQELEKNVHILSKNFSSNSNQQWEDWKNNDSYTAGLVAEKGALFLLYGDIENKSKFSIPVSISGKADLYYTGEVQGTGTFTNFIVGAMKLLSGINKINWTAGTKSGTYYFPELPAKTRSSYSILLNYEENMKKLGVNFFDLIKYKQEADIRNTQLTLDFLNFQPSENILTLQMITQDMVLNGLPDAKMTDLLRGKDVNDREWRSKWQKILEDRERYRREEEQRRQMAVASGRCWEFVKTDDLEYNGDNYRCNIYKDLVHNSEWRIFYYGGDESNDPGYYTLEGIIFRGLDNYGTTIEELLNELTECNER